MSHLDRLARIRVEAAKAFRTKPAEAPAMTEEREEREAARNRMLAQRAARLAAESTAIAPVKPRRQPARRAIGS